MASGKRGKHVTIQIEASEDDEEGRPKRCEGFGRPQDALTEVLLPSKGSMKHSGSCEMLGDAIAKFVESDSDEDHILTSHVHRGKSGVNKETIHVSFTNSSKLEQKRRLLRARTAPILARGTSIHKVKQKKVTRARVLMLQAALALLAYLFLGMLVYALQQDEFMGTRTHPVIDSIYFASVTMTTTGYGDLVPWTKKAKLFASAFAFAGLVLFGVIISGAGHYLLDKQERLLLEATRRHVHQSDMLEGELSSEESPFWKLLRAFLYISASLATGMLVLTKVENMNWVDALYCACVSVTSIGYGDRSFQTPLGRVFATFWLLLSVLTVAKSITLIAEARLAKRQRHFVKDVLSKGLTSKDFMAADIDNDGTLGLAEFAIFKLREMGKIQQDDLSQIRAQYQKLDLDDRGRLHIQSLPDYC